jgi:hypothetical protein
MNPAIAWCRWQQAEAHEHRKPDHTCDHPQCCPENNLRWLMDAACEELELLEAETKQGLDVAA